MVDVSVVRVFIDRDEQFGNPLGVVLDPAPLDQHDRQALAARLGFSETVYIDDLASARLQLFTPACELPFAGHALVGTAWLLARELGRHPDLLRPVLVDGTVPSFVEAGSTWISGAVSDAPPWEHVQLADVAAVEAAARPALGGRWQQTQVWAWADEPAGLVRARLFALAFGVPEDEACGSATLMLAAQLKRPITVHHGRGSVIHARPAGPDRAEVGGRVAFEQTLRC